MKTILNSSLKINFVTIWSTGTPNSYKPSVIEQMHIRESEWHDVVGTNHCFSSEDIVYAENVDIIGNVPAPDANRMGMAAALACVERSAKSIAAPLTISLEGFHSSQVLNNHLEAIVADANNLLKSLAESHKRSKLMYLRVCEMQMSWALFEVLPALARSCKPGLVAFSLNLPNDARQLNTQPNYATRQTEENGEGESLDSYAWNCSNPLSGIIRTLQFCSSSPHSALLVGVRPEETGSDTCGALNKEVYSVLQSHLEDIGLGDVLCSKALSISYGTRGTVAHFLTKLKAVISTIIKHCSRRYMIEIPLRVLLLRYIVIEHAREKDLWYITEKKLVSIAKDLGVFSIDDVHSFLTCFEQCASILYCRVEQFSSLLENIAIIDQAKFLNVVNKLSYAQQHFSKSTDTSLTPYLHKLKSGVVCSKLARLLWLDDHEVLLQILESIGAATLIDAVSSDEKYYFIPSLRSGYSYKDLAPTSCALYITFCQIFPPCPCSYLGRLYALLRNVHCPGIRLQDGTHCNQIELEWSTQETCTRAAVIVVRMTDSYLELEISEMEEQDAATVREIKGVLKSAVIDLFQNIAYEFPELGYDLCVVCPGCSSSCTDVVARPHFIRFHALLTVCSSIVYCAQCDSNVDVGGQRAGWIQAAYKVRGPLGKLYAVG